MPPKKKRAGWKGLSKPSHKMKAKMAAQKGKQKAIAKVKKICPKDTDIPILAQKWADLVESSVRWQWDEIHDEPLTDAAQSRIRAYARDNNLDDVAQLDPIQNYVNPPQNGAPFVKFPQKYIKHTLHLHKTMWLLKDTEQFKVLNEKIEEMYPDYDPDEQTFPPSEEKYTWHHDQHPPGQMVLVQFGIHNITSHTGGRSVWGGGTAKRK
jgi:hypothetical protein